MAQQDPNLLRVLISSDNHLGVWEKDEVRRDDSFRAFEEVLQLAVQLKVDFVLLGGDLFHENKPSRATLVRAISIISKYCLNDSPISFKVLSNQQVNFVSGRVNFEDPNLNIGLPIVTIHGNHDDPGGADNLSAVDILSSCNLINYFGKVLLSGAGVGQLVLSPILLQKGATKLALYGLGSIRDERLGRAFQTPGCVQWQRPASAPGFPAEEWLNLFVLHQNRVQHGAFAKACVQEQHLPRFLDVVIWGHEHECRPDPELIRSSGSSDADDSKRYIIQPGSTVATALSEGESKRKHAVLLEVLGDQYRTVKYPLMAVRPFVFDSLALREQQPPIKPEDQEAIMQLLVDKVGQMVQRAAQEQPPPAGQAPLLPLVRLRVDYTGFSTINSQRFGQRWVGKVANPQDMLLWTKAQTRKVKAEPGLASELEEGYLRPEALDQARIEDLIAQQLAAGGTALEVLPHEELALALHNFVEKEDKNALTACVEAALAETQRAALGLGDDGDAAAAALLVGEDEQAIMGAVRAGAGRRRTQKQAERKPSDIDITSLAPGSTAAGGEAPTGRYPHAADGDGDVDMQDTPAGPLHPTQAPTQTQGRGRGRGRGAAAAAKQQTLFDSLSKGGRAAPGAAAAAPSRTGGLDFGTAAAAATTGTTGRGRGRGGATGGRGRGRPKKGAAAEDSEEEDLHDAIESDEDEDDAGPSRGRATPAGPSRGRAATATAAAAGSSRAKRKVTQATKKYAVDSDDQGALSDGGSDGYGGAHAAADARRARKQEEDLIDSSDDDDAPPTSARKRGAAAARSSGRAAAPPPATTARGRAATNMAPPPPRTAAPVINISSSDEDSPRPAGTRGAAPPPMGSLGTLMTTQGTTQGGLTQAPGATQAGATQGGRKRPASFLTTSSAQQRPGGAAGLKGWGQAR